MIILPVVFANKNISYLIRLVLVVVLMELMVLADNVKVVTQLVLLAQMVLTVDARHVILTISWAIVVVVYKHVKMDTIRILQIILVPPVILIVLLV